MNEWAKRLFGGIGGCWRRAFWNVVSGGNGIHWNSQMLPLRQNTQNAVLSWPSYVGVVAS